MRIHKKLVVRSIALATLGVGAHTGVYWPASKRKHGHGMSVND